MNSIALADYLSEIIVIGDMNFSCHTHTHDTGLETFKEGLMARSLLNASFCTDLYSGPVFMSVLILVIAL